MTSTAAAEVLRYHATDHLVASWRNDNEQRRYESACGAAFRARFNFLLAFMGGFVGVPFAIVAALDMQSGSRAVIAAEGAVLLLLGVVGCAHSVLRLRAARIARAKVDPFLSTPAAAWAYEAALSNPSSDHARAEQCRAALNGLTPAEQAKHPEHAALLTLGHAAAAA